MRAILHAQVAVNPAAEATLVLGARHSSELLFRGEFEAMAERFAGFRYLPTVSGADGGWRGRRGRVTDHLDEALGGRSDLVTYFCGHSEMVARMRRSLAEAGIPDERQCFERY